MIAAPAVDVRGGRCVQLVGGVPEEERVSLPDPVAVARRWWETGFGSLHVVDLDAALGEGGNRETVRDLLDATGATVQVGGGIRDDGTARELLDAGADRIVVGTRAVDDPEWLGDLARRHPGRVTVAADVREGKVLRRGWTEATPLGLFEFVERISILPLAGVLCTDVGGEGRMEGTDVETARELARRSDLPVWIAGGIATMAELRALDDAGVAGAVLGMALYAGSLDPAAAAEAYGSEEER